MVLPLDHILHSTWVYSQQTQVLGLAPDCSPLPWLGPPPLPGSPARASQSCLALTHTSHTPTGSPVRTSHCRHLQARESSSAALPSPSLPESPAQAREPWLIGTSEFRPWVTTLSLEPSPGPPWPPWTTWGHILEEKNIFSIQFLLETCILKFGKNSCLRHIFFFFLNCCI